MREVFFWGGGATKKNTMVEEAKYTRNKIRVNSRSLCVVFFQWRFSRKFLEYFFGNAFYDNGDEVGLFDVFLWNSS
jgi:hypothetical protein